jgi:hypothetical protein
VCCERVLSRNAFVGVYYLEEYGVRVSNSLTGLAVVVVLLASSGGLTACDMNVREAGFINNMGGPYYARPYMLWVFCAKKTEPIEQHVKDLSKYTYEEMEGTNLALDVVEIEKVKPEERKMLAESGVNLDSLPATVLAREAGYEFQILTSVNRMVSRDDIKGMLTSPRDHTKKTTTPP